jgi:hypothetical protein
MDNAILSASSALIGSLIGGMSTLAASWLSLRGRVRAQALVQEAAKREALYAEFIIEASRRLSETWSHQAESPEVLAGLYSAHQRMRLTSSDEVIRLADYVIRLVIQAYAAPDKTFDELRQHIAASDEQWDPLRGFAEACRAELRALLG